MRDSNRVHPSTTPGCLVFEPANRERRLSLHLPLPLAFTINPAFALDSLRHLICLATLVWLETLTVPGIAPQSRMIFSEGGRWSNSRQSRQFHAYSSPQLAMYVFWVNLISLSRLDRIRVSYARIVFYRSWPVTRISHSPCMGPAPGVPSFPPHAGVEMVAYPAPAAIQPQHSGQAPAVKSRNAWPGWPQPRSPGTYLPRRCCLLVQGRGTIKRQASLRRNVESCRPCGSYCVGSGVY